MWCHGLMDKGMSCKTGVSGSIPGFSIKPLSVEPSGVPVIKYTHKSYTLPAQFWLLPWKSHKKFLFILCGAKI